MIFEIKNEYLNILLGKASVVSGGMEKALQSFLFELDVERSILKVVRTDTILYVMTQTKLFNVVNADPPHQVLIPSDHILTLSNNLRSADNVVISYLGGEVVDIKAENYSASWGVLSFDKFPAFPDVELSDSVIHVDSVNFIRAVERVSFVLPDGDYRLPLTEIHFDSSGCWVLADNRYQRVDFCGDEKVEFSVPMGALSVVKFIAKSGSSSFTIHKGKGFIVFSVGADVFICRDNQPKKPAVKFLYDMERANQSKFKFDIQELRMAIKRAGITSAVNSKAIVFIVDQTNLSLSSHDKFENSSSELLPFKLDKKINKASFGVNWQYFDKALSVVNDKSAEIFVDKEFLLVKGGDSLGLVPMSKGLK